MSEETLESITTSDNTFAATLINSFPVKHVNFVEIV